MFADMIYFVFRGGTGPPDGPYFGKTQARMNARACADVDNADATILGIPVTYMEIVLPLSREKEMYEDGQ